MTPSVIVPDASVLVKWSLESQDEEDRGRALSVREACLSGKCRVIVPSIWLYEVGNILALKQPRLARQLLDIQVAYRFPEETAATLYTTILELMFTLRVSFYDAAYHATAIKHRGTLITADLQYFKKAERKGHILRLQDWSEI